jgi:hypothetical protein
VLTQQREKIEPPRLPSSTQTITAGLIANQRHISLTHIIKLVFQLLGEGHAAAIIALVRNVRCIRINLRGSKLSGQQDSKPCQVSPQMDSRSFVSKES